MENEEARPRSRSRSGRSRGRSRRRQARLPGWVGLPVTITLAMLLGWWFGATRGFYVPTESMLPAIQKWDRFQAETWQSRETGPQRGEIWVLENPDPLKNGGPYLIKRVMGLPGEKVQVRNGKVLINDKPIHDPWAKEPASKNTKPIRLKEGEYWLLGDNRNFSQDSRTWGPVRKPQLVGRVFLRFWPITRWQLF